MPFVRGCLSCAAMLQGSGCNCTDQLRREAFSNLTSALEEGEDISVAGDAAAACKYGGSVPHGFISEILSDLVFQLSVQSLLLQDAFQSARCFSR